MSPSEVDMRSPEAKIRAAEREAEAAGGNALEPLEPETQAAPTVTEPDAAAAPGVPDTEAIAAFAALIAPLDDEARAKKMKQVKLRVRLLTGKDEPTASLLGQRKKLGSLYRDGVPAPTFLPSPTHGERLFYEGHVFLFAGHKKAGKSWSMILEARDCIAAGRPVVYVDNENGAELFAERLILAGKVTADEVDEHLHYVPFPQGLTVEGLRAEFDAIREALPGAFVVIDSLRSIMARFGLNPEKNVEVEQVFGPIMAAVKSGELDGRITVGVIDHSNRSTTEGDAYVASGAAAKAQAVDAVYYFDKVEAFSRDVQGAVKVSVKDDRRGLLDFDRYYRVGGQGDGQPLHFQHAEAEEFTASGRILLDVRQVVMDAGKAVTKTAVRAAVKGDSGKIDAALATLVSDPSEPIWTESKGSRVLYVWDDERKVQAGLEI